MSNTEQAPKKLVWLDCDPGADDAMAIFLAGYSPSIKLLGISTVHGNASLVNVTKNALKLLKVAGIQDIPVYVGLNKALTRPQDDSFTFHGDDGVGGVVFPEPEQQPITKEVFHTIYKEIISHSPQKVHFVATGCLSNIALLLMNYPDIKDHLEQISIMGGAMNLGNQSPSSEFNIQKDPEAAKIVFASGVKLIMSPLDLTLQVRVNESVKAKLEAFNSEFTRSVIKMLNYYSLSYLKTFGFEHPPLHDPCALYYVINPDVYETKFLNVEIETKSEFCDGRTVVDFYGVTGRKPNCNVAFSMNQEPFWKEIMDAIALCDARSPINQKDSN